TLQRFIMKRSSRLRIWVNLDCIWLQNLLRILNYLEMVRTNDHRSRFQCREECVLFPLTQKWRKRWRMEIWGR
ncbi:hypothetical protein S245_067256, partial [Arachis hypogaea]